MKYFTLLFLFVLGTTQLLAQSIDEEIGFIYTKAKYLIETNRTEDAVKELNKIIKKDPEFKDALLLRAEAKYQLGAYAGVKKDLATYVGFNGITARVARLYGLTDFQGGNTDAALNSLSIALMSIKDDKKMYELRAQIYESDNQLLKACEDFKQAGKLGSNIGKRKSKALCGADEVKEEPKKKRRTQLDANPSKADVEKEEIEIVKEEETMEEEENEASEEESEKTQDPEVIEKEEMEEEKEEEIIEETINEILVDDDLTLVISGGGLGSRKIVDKPNILILSDDSGEVSINVCVSRAGRVTNAEFDNINSTIKKQSLVSLALRKSKDFWFEKKGTKEQCGSITFRIQGI